MSLQTLRKQVDRIDAQIVRLLHRRARLALQIGRVKRQRRRPVYDARREALVLRHVTTMDHGPLSARAVQRIFHAVLRECRHRQRIRRKNH